MKVGASATATIQAREYWNDTGIDLTAGEEYRLAATGRWKEAWMECGPEGYQRLWLRPVGWMRRMPGEPWMALVGSIGGEPTRMFRIGAELVIRARYSGRLFCFANDVGVMYWNNSGSVELTVTRTA